ncbi:DNA-binding protein WhiA, partial [uncultured Selenomonas sp.]|uniref:DNA-binding protein WhiA n=1 Tax=uncultured Selenomonas sp. TaxID=159275 RepID=UPI0028DB1132
MAQPSFSAEVKNDLARPLGRKACCRTAELAALLRMGAALTLGAKRAVGLAFTTENAAVARKALMLLKGSAGVHTELTVSRSRRLKKNNSYRVHVLPSREAAALMERLGLMHGSAFNMGTDSALLKKACCRKAYLRGAFLGGGSVSRPDAGYHVELVTESYSFAELLLALLLRMCCPSGL